MQGYFRNIFKEIALFYEKQGRTFTYLIILLALLQNMSGEQPSSFVGRIVSGGKWKVLAKAESLLRPSIFSFP